MGRPRGAARARTEAVGNGTRITVALRGLDDALGEDPEAPAAWFGSELLAPLLRATSAERLGDWVTDRRVRRPSGASSRKNSRDPAYHWPNFDAVLDELALQPSDRLLEVGCGVGRSSRLRSQSDCTAAEVDHSSDMVRLARELKCRRERRSPCDPPPPRPRRRARRLHRLATLRALTGEGSPPERPGNPLSTTRA